MVTKIRKHPDNAKQPPGQSLVELGLSMMVILWLLSGAVDFGLGFFSYVAIRDAAQDGALYGSLYPPTSTGAREEIIARVRQSSTSPVNLTDTSRVEVEVTTYGSICASHPLTVSVIYHYPVSMALVGAAFGSTINIQASSTSTILKPACP
jgi:Flp pilus assembly protein TadG